MFHSLEVLSNIVRQPTQQYPAQIQPPQQYDEDMGYRTMTREDVAMIQERRISNSILSPQQTSPMTPQNNIPVAPTIPNSQPNPSPVSPPNSSGGHQRTASAPPAPPPPPMAVGGCAPPAPPGPPMPPGGPLAAAPPPPPPPPMNMSRSQSSDGGEINSLAAQLQNARLKKNKVRFSFLENSFLDLFSLYYKQIKLLYEYVIQNECVLFGVNVFIYFFAKASIYNQKFNI